MKKILKKLKKIDLTDYASIPFWSWNNDLKEDELIEQINCMKASGCGGFIIHARTGLTNEYLSEDWFNLVFACLKEARKLKMNVWIYDENGWPSGFVGGKLLENEDYRARFLERKESDSFDKEASKVYAKINGKMRLVNEGEVADDGKYLNVYIRISPANTDILNPATVTAFIKETHEEYYKRFKEYFGKEIKGFFTDEPQYYRADTPFTYSLVEYFEKHYEENVFDGLYNLFSQEEENYPFRVKYYKALNDLYVHNYYKALYDWCESHNCMLTGHSVEETKLFSQMWGGAGCSTSYEFEHIPGIDNLGKFNTASLSARQVGSVSGQLGSKQILTETFGCAGYDTTPKELKAVAEKQYVHGVNLMCQHLYSYSLKGQGKTDHPPCFSPHITWNEEFKDFNDYFTRLGYLLANSNTKVNCAVINPMNSIHLNYLRYDQEKAAEIDIAFDKLIETLNSYGILYDLIDETILYRYGSVNGKTLSVGERDYDYIIIPEVLTLYASTKETLEQYVKNGGNIYAVSTPIYTNGVKDDWSFIKSNVDLIDIKRAGAVNVESDGKCEYTYRVGKGFEFLYIVNVSKEDALVRLDKEYNAVDLLKFTLTKQEKEFALGKGESIILTPKGKGKKPAEYSIDSVVTDFEFVSADKNTLTLDTARFSFDGESWSEEVPIMAYFDKLLRDDYRGKLFVKYPFKVEGGYKEQTILRRESGKYISQKLNGEEIVFAKSQFDFKFEEADITPFIKDGINEYIVEMDYYQRPQVRWALFDPLATESVRNCLYYDTEIENVYILGNFNLQKDRVIRPFIAPSLVSDFSKNGFVHFAGAITFKTKVEAISNSAKLTFNGKYVAVRVSVNGKKIGSAVFGESIVVPLNKGETNEIEISVVSSLRNTFGPFHLNGIENLCDVGPIHFTLRTLWNDFKCDLFAEEYYFSPFGIDSVKISQ